MSEQDDSGLFAGSTTTRPRRCQVLPETRRLLLDGTEVRLGGRAFDLLWTLLEKRGNVVPKQYLHDAIWPGVCVTPNNLDVQIWALRQRLGQDAISTVPRQGYMLTDAIEFAVVGSASRAPQAQPNRSDTIGSDPGELMAQSLARRLKKLGQLALVGADASTRQMLCSAICKAYLRLGSAVIWRIEVQQATDLARLEQTISRMRRVGGLMVVSEGDASLRTSVHEWTRLTDGDSGTLNCLTTAAEAVAGIDRHIHAVTPLKDSTGRARSDDASRSHLRWHSRGPGYPQ